MTKGIYIVLSNCQLARDTWEMVLGGDTSALTNPGQFINIAIEGLYLRRPISVCCYDPGTITIIYKVVGKGTRKLSAMTPGDTLDVIVGLGNGFDVAKAHGRKIAVIGGGVGVPPMYDTARRLAAQGEDVTAILGFATKDVSFYIEKFEALGVRLMITTDDGSMGQKGFVTDALRESGCDYVMACGPTPMLKGVHRSGIEGQLSFEERMGCGFGACMGCTCQTLVGPKRVCLDGPVFSTSEVSFE
ncbi:MAG: dihydroorotate dehydrogenase electron transfer subunit [Oscillospiraceae bacterium]|nr:dihydroorotate dehydrogenase electron transfer subunit [Oscillospiraceae bacterium]